MRLINTRTLGLEEFFDALVPKYAILSHTWEKGEVLFRDMEDLNKARAKPGFSKLQGACTLAATQGYDYIWIDTCCIDKSSSAELSEAINSMYKWYKKSRVCYAYLCDVDKADQLGDSRWFTRGWTLQELIAPSRVEFYSASWASIGERQDSDLISVISKASLVDQCVLSGVIHAQRDVSVAKRMYWASKRTTTRQEDEAYCLMGLFNINMPLLYGEGDKAFFRLQQEIVKDSDDQSILAWYCDSDTMEAIDGVRDFGYSVPCYATSPRCFAYSGNIYPLPRGPLARALGNIQLKTSSVEFSAIREESYSRDRGTIFLHCQVGPIPGTFPTLSLDQTLNNQEYHYRTIQPGYVSEFSLHRPEFLLANTGLPPEPSQAAPKLWTFDFPGTGQREMSRCDQATNPLSLIKVDQDEGQPAGTASSLVVNTTDDIPNKVNPEYPRYTIERVTISHVEIYIVGFSEPTSPEYGNEYKYDSGNEDEDEDGAKARREWEDLHYRHMFWLVPLDIRGSKHEIFVVDALPIERWDRSNHQLIWSRKKLERFLPTKEFLSSITKLARHDWNPSMTAGVARIRFHPLDIDTSLGIRDKGRGVAVVVFGLTRIRSSRSHRRCRYSTIPWCRLVKDDGVADLEQHFTTQVFVQDAQAGPSSLTLDAGILLHASAVRTDVAGREYDLIKLWVTKEVVGERDAVMSEH